LEKSLLVTRIVTPLNEEVTIPNGAVLSSEVKNYSAKAQDGAVVLTVEAGIWDDVDWRTVHSLLVEAVLKTPGILAAPAPVVMQMALGDFAVNHELRARTLDGVNMVPIGSQLRENVLDAFSAAGVEIMTPNLQADRDASGMAIPPE
jgi:small-conductance mechanosensitive channel